MRTTKGTERESLSTTTVEYMKVTGSMTSVRGEAMRCSPTETSTRESSCKGRRMARGSISGETGRSMTVSGYMESRRATESGRAQTGSPTSDSGRQARQKAMECMSGLMETGMKESGGHASDMEMVPISSLTEICTLDSINTANLKGMVSTSGSTGTLTKEHLRTVSNTEMESGEKLLTRLYHLTAKRISMKAIISMIRKTGGASLSGSQATHTEAVTSMIKEKVLERCNGLMVLSTEAPGTKVSSMASE